MSKEITRRNFLKSMLAGGVAVATMSPLELLASQNESFKGAYNETYDVAELYSNGMVFSERQPESIPGTETKLSYFVRDSDDVRGIDDVQFNYQVSDKGDKSRKFTARVVGKIVDGKYTISDVQTDGQLFQDPIKQYQFESGFFNDFKAVLEDGVNENLSTFNAAFQKLSSNKRDLNPTPTGYNPFQTKYEKREETMRGVQDILFK